MIFVFGLGYLMFTVGAYVLGWFFFPAVGWATWAIGTGSVLMVASMLEPAWLQLEDDSDGVDVGVIPRE